MPADGALFTSQSPFPCIFLAGLVAWEKSDRKVVCDWFDTVTSDASPRSNVPPVYRLLKALWEWMDRNHVGEYSASGTLELLLEAERIGNRDAWWESVVAQIVERDGIISLC